MTALPEWLDPPPTHGWTVDDLDRLADDAPRHVEIIDGALIPTGPRTAFHGLMLKALENGLTRQKPKDLLVMREWTVVVAPPQGPEPDILVIPDALLRDPMQTRVDARHVLLAAEVVSADSRTRDYGRKRHLYAEAGIPHYWIIDYEQATKTTRISVYERDPGTEAYVATGLFHDVVEVKVPFPVVLDLSWSAIR
ncbi:Uma2 family endonuclease [Embleya sp. AB8]|uniref:Uma2 family endonuclease n=1 Tax=Embleya sp. AB8 TaxID=3156304 RepID=UPI003C74FA3C